MTYEEALTKIEKYEKKLKVMAVRNWFEFGIRKYAICFPAGCAIYQDSKDPYRAREYLSRRTGIMVQEGHPFYTSEDGVLLNKEKTAL